MNKFYVGLQGDKVRVMGVQKVVLGLTKDEAINLAAWLLVMADDVDLEKVKIEIADAMSG